MAFTGAATLPVGGAVLALVALPGHGPRPRVKPLLWLQAVLLALIVGLGLAGILAPSLVPGVPEAGGTRRLGRCSWSEWSSTACWRCAPRAPSC